jgi:glutamine cyclotransferase
MLYEGTGQKSRSELKKINPMNGETIMERKLENDFFGEGITLFNNQIYQLTYLSRVGLVYELETFEFIRKFDLQTREGWGLTNDGHNLIVSDGSSILYLYDPEYNTQVGQLDVCDNKGLVNSLNELEYVNGSIFANIYGQSYILEIEAKTGKVIGKLELKDIFPKGIPDNLDYVLNGIAYNPDANTYFVTGKLWPVMYEINIFE